MGRKGKISIEVKMSSIENYQLGHTSILNCILLSRQYKKVKYVSSLSSKVHRTEAV